LVGWGNQRDRGRIVSARYGVARRAPHSDRGVHVFPFALVRVALYTLGRIWVFPEWHRMFLGLRANVRGEGKHRTKDQANWRSMQAALLQDLAQSSTHNRVAAMGRSK
jgi:hypothetical protein